LEKPADNQDAAAFRAGREPGRKAGGTANRRKSRATRQRIVDSAKRLFAEHGFQKTTVADISRRAGVSEAALYEYFQGKEGLLLTIPGLWVSELLEGLEEQMLGIRGAFNRLRKYLWWNLRQAERSPLDAKIVYLYLKTNASFLQTEVYADVKRLYRRLIDIFEQGVAEGEMRPDLDPYVARGLVVAAMDHLITRWLLKDMTYSIYDRLDQTFELLQEAFASEGHRELEKARRGLRPEPAPEAAGG
jgi:TetR/AcrR family fatty acid metabolism transcriptional regulator